METRRYSRPAAVGGGGKADELSVLAACFGLFWGAFLAATILPGASELLLIALIAEGIADPWLLVLVAGIGNTLGSVVNWFCGRFLLRYQERRWFPVKPKQLEAATRFFNRYGVWTLLFAWSPLGGDALTVIAGTLRVPLVPFVVLVAIGKFARYVVVAGATLAWPGL